MLIGNTFVDPLRMPFSRRGSYLCLANKNSGSNQYGKAQLWLSTSRLRPSDRHSGAGLFQSNRFRQVKLELVKDGLPRPSVISTTPYELTLQCEPGSVRFCLGDRKYAICRGEDGLTLRLTPMYGGIGGPQVVNLLDGTWKTAFGNYNLLLIPIAGTLKPGPGGALDLVPGDDGVVELVMEEHITDPKRQASYLGYDEGVAAVKADFDSFAARIAPSFPDKYKETGLQALWVLWGLTVSPDDASVYKRDAIKMMRICFEAVFSWQLGMHAMFLAHDLPFAWNLLLASFDYQDSTGRIADALTYKGPGETMKPPIQGLGLLWLMEHHDLSVFPVEDKAFLYERMANWTMFHLDYRDLDQDGLVETQSAGETGWESGSLFTIGFPQVIPDINAYIALQMEALGKLGRLIGKEEAECAAWETRSAEMIQKIIDKCWTPDGWTSVNIVTGARSVPFSMSNYCALLLGKRLPEDIINRSIEIVCGAQYDTPYGLGSEPLDSPYFMHGWCRGSIAMPIQALMAIAMEYCGRPDLAKKIARRYMDTLIEHGLYHIHNPLDGEVEYGGGVTFFEETAMCYSGWSAGCYIFFAERYCQD